jgi:hypothetical protein
MSNILPNSLCQYCCLGRDDVLVGFGTQFHTFRMLHKNCCRNFLCALKCYEGSVLPPKRRHPPTKFHGLRLLNAVILECTTVTIENLTLNYGGLFNVEITTTNWIT